MKDSILKGAMLNVIVIQQLSEWSLSIGSMINKYRSAAVGCACGFIRKHLEAHGLHYKTRFSNFCIPWGYTILYMGL